MKKISSQLSNLFLGKENRKLNTIIYSVIICGFFLYFAGYAFGEAFYHYTH